jgi:alpha-1,3-glucan synthase
MNGTEKQLLASFITTLHMPGIPMTLWGEEQGFYVLDNTATNYIFGRQAMSSALAWEVHGCYQLGAEQYYKFPVESALTGCEDPWNSLDHRDPSSPLRNTMKAMYQMRENYPVLNDGLYLQQLSNQTRDITLPGSNGTVTETGIWSTLRSRFDTVQDLSGSGNGNQSVWLVYQNDNTSTPYTFDCTNNETALISPFDAGTTVKNLFYPWDEVILKTGPKKLGIAGSENYNGCLDELQLPPWGFKAYVPKDNFTGTGPMITKFSPGHDHRLVSAVAADEQESVAIELHFSMEMDCDALKSSIELNSTTENGHIATLDNSTVSCKSTDPTLLANFVGSIPTMWIFTANITNVSNGIHSLTVRNASNVNGTMYTNSVDRFIFRVGQLDNPMIFPKIANYTQQLLHQNDNGSLYVSHKAAGADSWRYTLDWATYSEWMPYTGGNSTLNPKNWTGTAKQAWSREHLIVQYFNRLSGSSDYFQHGDLKKETPRRLPHLFAHGPFNQYGYDAGLVNEFKQDENGLWNYDFMTEWPSIVQLSK